ncbi:hypothetical protein HUT03_04665 [Candidatus Liberibacter africanus]|uniref:SMODS and SLOG-associating 2TM effector domain-containing protein n=1 Tax=Candidatus Liberibacter africanus PTSAPSY TaxID=1277257 RepID=A0A0G3I9R1_LIBAF|nr:hypothetical protein G293_04585 [Candidatus Liberibacter africanus PTSAPSY]QTP64238.1 hypothetical protein HUT03_04665 [Candidatus Liberibacter africanus]
MKDQIFLNNMGADFHIYNLKKWRCISKVLMILLIFLGLAEKYCHIGIAAFSPIIATSLASIFGLISMKTYNELSLPYILTARELERMLAESYKIESEYQFSNWVLKSESAFFSRKHTVWAGIKIWAVRINVA